MIFTIVLQWGIFFIAAKNDIDDQNLLLATVFFGLTTFKMTFRDRNSQPPTYWVIQNDCGWQLCTKIYEATVCLGWS
jgi:hypothetical protein